MSTADNRNTARLKAQASALDAIERIAGVDGIGGLSLKRLADEAGASTMSIYTQFGDRFGLEEAFVARSVTSLHDALTPADGVALTQQHVATAVRAWAHEFPARFSVLFVTSHQLHPDLHDEIRAAIRELGTLLSDASVVRNRDHGIALIAALSGLIAFELRGLFPDGEWAYDELLVGSTNW